MKKHKANGVQFTKVVSSVDQLRNAREKFTNYGSKEDRKRIAKINKVFDRASAYDPNSRAGLDRIRAKMNARQLKTLTIKEADFVIGVCCRSGLRLKRQTEELLQGYKPTEKPWWWPHYEQKMKEARERYELERNGALPVNQ